MRRLSLLAVGVGVLLALVLAGCVGSRPYQTALGPRPTLPGGVLAVSPSLEKEEGCVFASMPSMVAVEFDDYGNLMNRAQLEAAVEAAKETASNRGTVIVYVHGWHNSACKDSRDVVRFSEMIERVSTASAQGGKGPVRGIYVGWRGDSIRSDGLLIPFSNLLTFWDRKSAAHNIGASGGVYELFSRLSEVRRSHAKSRLLIHGHSFGGALVFSTLTHALVDQIRRDAEPGEEKKMCKEEKARPMADLVLLVNPALEAMKLRPQWDLARSQVYQDALPPRLVILTAQGDWASRLAFPLGRFFGTLTDAYADAQSLQENRQTVGNYLPYITHQLAVPETGECLGVHAKELDSLLAVQQEKEPSELCIPPSSAYGEAKPVMLRRCDARGSCSKVAGEGHYIARGKPAEGRVPYRLPIMNIRATDDVSRSHTDFRNDTLENFVFRLMTLAVEAPGSLPMGNGAEC